MFKNSDRRNDLDKAYHVLIRALFDNVERMAEEHQKTPRAVVMMGRSLDHMICSHAIFTGQNANANRETELVFNLRALPW